MTKETSIQEEINITSNFSAAQGEEYPHPAKQQLHPAKYQLEHIEDEEIQEFFFLITGIDEKNNTCEVISGSFDGLKAGPEDIVLPKSVLGQYVYLSPGIGGTVPTESLGTGFAVLDTPTFECICKAQNEYKAGKVQPIPSWPRAMRYISDHDDRIAYHEMQKSLLQAIQREAVHPKKKFFPFAPPFKHFYKVAAVLFVGALVTCLVIQQSTPSEKEAGIAYAHIPQSTPSEKGAEIAYGDTPQARQYAFEEKRNTAVIEDVLQGVNKFLNNVIGKKTSEAPQEKFKAGEHISPEKLVAGKTSTEVRHRQLANLPVYSPKGQLYNSRPPIAVGSKGQNYTVTIRDSKQDIVGEKEIAGGEFIAWEDFTGTSNELKEGEKYSIQVQSGKNLIAQKNFCLLEQSERKKMNDLIAKQDKTTLSIKKVIGVSSGAIYISHGVVGEMGYTAVQSDDKEYKAAQILFDQGCYSDAYFKITLLYEVQKDNEKYKALRDECLKKLGIKGNTEN